MTVERQDTLTLRQAALIVGFAYLLNPVSYAEFSLYPHLVVIADINRTIANIGSQHGLFLAAIFCYLINFLEDIVIAWALYYLFVPVNRALSLLASLFQWGFAVISLVGTFDLVLVYRMIATPKALSSVHPGEFNTQIDFLLHAFRYDFSFGIATLFSIHLVLVGYLIVRSGYIPWWLGVILIVDGVGWVVTGLKPYLYPDANLGLISLTSLGELVFMLWLLIRGWKVQESRRILW